MDATTFIALATACAPLVHPATTQAITATESAMNPNAIGVVGGRLVRQPRTRTEAIATAKSLLAQRQNFSVGLAQINVHTLRRIGLSLDDAFDECLNLQGMQRVLGDCYARAVMNTDEQASLRRALSCYYSGNFSTGFRMGYVAKVVGNHRIARRRPP